MFWSRSDEGRELSNFYIVPFPLVLKCGTFTFSSAEAAYQCLKQPKLTKGKITPFQLAVPSAAREYGRTVPLREDWESVKDDIMWYVLEAKFRIPEMKEYLLSTYPRRLIHWSPWDLYWGVGNDGKGLNKLGLALQGLRTELQKEPTV